MRRRERHRIGPWLVTIVGTVVVLVVVQALVLKLYTIPSESMRPTLDIGDRVGVSRLGYEPERGDIVVFVEGGQPSFVGDVLDLVGLGSDRQVIKRVVAIPGDVVASDAQGRLQVNGETVDEPYLPVGSSVHVDPTEIADDVVFVLGDNRNFSRDSRSIGPIPLTSVVGRAVIRFWPVTNMGSLR